MATGPQAPRAIASRHPHGLQSAIALERPSDGPKAASRPLGNLRIDELVSELREARLVGDIARLRRLLDETSYRKSKFAARLGARVRVSLLALEKPDALPFFMK